MKNVLLILGILVSVHTTFGQSQISKDSLVREVSQGNNEAILLIKNDSVLDAETLEFLKQLASGQERKKAGSSAYNAHVALARLGNENALNEIGEEIRQNDPESFTGMAKVFLVGGKYSLKTFFSLLDDSTQIESPAKDILYYPKNVMAVLYLSKIIGNPPTKKGVPSNNINAWKAWFAKHPEVIQ